MQTTSYKSHQAWLQALAGEYKISLSEIARRASISPSTLTRFVKTGTPGNCLRADTVSKIVSALGAPPPSLPGQAQLPASAPAISVPVDARYLLEAGELGLNLTAVVRVAVEKEIKAERLRQWSLRNQAAAKQWDQLIEEEGLWSDRLRQF